MSAQVSMFGSYDDYSQTIQVKQYLLMQKRENITSIIKLDNDFQ